MIGAYENIYFALIYIAVILVYTIWWSSKFQQYRKDNPGQYEEYMKYYSEYYGDDLNEDGIKDAFEHWKIAHDPRFFWIFGSKLEKEKRRFEREKSIFFFRTGSEHYDESIDFSYRKRDRSEQREQREANARKRNDYRNYYGNGSSNGYSGSSEYNSYRSNGANTGYNSSRSYSTNTGYNSSYGQSSSDSRTMSEEEQKIAKQHAFAREHNLRYFAMCESKSEAKKLYRKYAAKYHPDNNVTGDKEKFIKIDEEYNRFCKIDTIG